MNMLSVLGSINMDLVTEVPHLSQPGETVLGRRFDRYPGGKGANQAVAAARLGAQVSFYGKTGVDPFGEELLNSLAENGIDVSAVKREEGQSTGTASIWVADNGENIIAYAPGAMLRWIRPTSIESYRGCAPPTFFFYSSRHRWSPSVTCSNICLQKTL